MADAGHLDILSSDYVPAITLPQAIGFVSLRPAAAWLDDRGMIELTKRADLVQINLRSGIPVVRRVWREGIWVL
jgi:alpha-D-ribose 1-methylphosphonate 5-triphosphate diphosphatase